MLKNTFCHLPGIGPKKERLLWSQGLLTWDEVLNRASSLPEKFRHLEGQIARSQAELERGNCRFFGDQLPKNESWRLFETFRERTAYVDIETTGRGGGLDHITTIALYDGSRVKTYVCGDNLEDFADDILDYQLLVTFNGSCFDVPFLKRELCSELPPAHIDLRFLLASLGIRGGLKRCEKSLGLDRGVLDGADGYLAVLLWEEYRTTGEEAVLDTLLAYNVEDVINLEVLLVEACNRKMAELPFEPHPLQAPAFQGINPYEPHARVLDSYRHLLSRF
jgi:hypothetical protein